MRSGVWSWRNTSPGAARPGLPCGPAPRRLWGAAAPPALQLLACQISRLDRIHCSRRPVLTLSSLTPATVVPDDGSFREPKATVQIWSRHPSARSPSPRWSLPFLGPQQLRLRSMMCLLLTLWPSLTGPIKSVIGRLPGVPAWTRSEPRWFQTSGTVTPPTTFTKSSRGGRSRPSTQRAALGAAGEGPLGSAPVPHASS